MSLGLMERGFADPVQDSQRVFRTALDALARPGRVAQLAPSIAAPPPLLGTSASLLLTLADFETSVWLDDTLGRSTAVGEFIRFHTGARLTSHRREADFAVIAAPLDMPPLATFAAGTPEYPDRSTSIIVQVETLADRGWRLNGPGIADRASFSAAPVPADLPRQLVANRAHFPLGIDLIFVTATEIAALPRSTRLGESG